MLLPVIAVVCAGVAIVGILAAQAMQARSHLTAARDSLATVESGLREGRLRPDDHRIQQAVAAAARNTHIAHGLTSGRMWRWAAAVPVAGCPLRSSASLAAAADTLTSQVIRPLAALAPVANPQRGPGGVTVNVTRVRAAAGQVAQLAEDMRLIRNGIDRASACGLLGRGLGVTDARSELSTRVGRLDAMVTDLRAATALLPGMLGADQPRRYLLVVQNDGESRATGGIIGGYGFLRAAHGRLSVDVSTARLPSFGTTPVLALDKEMQTRYARFGIAQYWANPNLTPDYPTAARIFAAMWAKGTGQHVDGVVTVDPTLLGYLLAAVGSARMPDGQLVNGQQLAPLLESQIYARIPTNEQRDVYFSAAGAAIYRALLASGTSPVRLLPALGRGAGEGRLLVWSRRPAEQRTLQTTPLAGELPSTPGPFLGVVTQNAAGSKLDYWLRRATDYRLRRLADGSAEATLTVRVTNTAPPRGLPAYVRLRIEDGAPRHPPPAQNKIYLSVYTGVGAGFTGATLDGRPTTLESETEKGHGVFSTFLTINAGQTRTLRLVIAEPLWGPRVTIRPQPLVQPERLTVTGAKISPVSADIAP